MSSASGFAALAGILWLGCAGPATKDAPDTTSPADPAAEIAAAHEALAADSSDVEAWFRLGAAWQDVGGAQGVDSSRIAFERLLAIEPENVQALVHYGLALEDSQRPTEALDQYRRATELAPDDPLPYINLGSLLYFHLGRTYDAKTALSRALELAPENPDAHFNLGVLFADAHMYREAQTEWQAALELAPDSPAGNLARANLEKIAPLLQDVDPPDTGEGGDSSP